MKIILWICIGCFLGYLISTFKSSLLKTRREEALLEIDEKIKKIEAENKGFVESGILDSVTTEGVEASRRYHENKKKLPPLYDLASQLVHVLGLCECSNHETT